MSEGEVEVESQTITPILPKDVSSEIGTVKLFNKWSYEDVEIRDISLTYDYLSFGAWGVGSHGDIVWLDLRHENDG